MNRIDDIHLEVTKNMVNILLFPSNIHIENFEEVKNFLPKLVEQLLDEKIDSLIPIPTNVNMNSVLAKKKLDTALDQNFKILKAYLIKKNKSFNFIEFPQTTKDLLALTKLIIDKFYIVNTQKELVNLISSYLNDFQSILPIKNMDKSWIFGLPFIALLSKASNGSIQYEDKGNTNLNFNYIKESCDKLNIPFVLTEKCISDHPDSYCNSIQATIILKSLNCFQTQSLPEENNKKRFEEKINCYLKSVQDANDLIKNEENQLNKFKKCISSDEIRKLNDLIHNFNKTGIIRCRDAVNNAKDLYDTIKRLSHVYNLQIPSNLIDINEINQKLDLLNENIQKRKLNIDEESAKINQIEEEVGKINNLDDAKQIYNKLKNEYDLDNWKEAYKNTFIYSLGEKLDMYENMLKNTTNQYEQLLTSFDILIDSISNKINENPNDLEEINNDISQFDQKFVSIQNLYFNIKTIEPQNQIELPDYSLRMKKIKDKLFEIEQSNLKKCIEKEFNIIKTRCESIDIELKKINYNHYSKNLCKTARNEHNLSIPCSNKYESLFEKLKINHDFQYKKEDAQKLINITKQKVEDAFELLSKRENEASMLESISADIEKERRQLITDESQMINYFSCYDINKCMELRANESIELINQLNEFLVLFNDAQNKKKWDENAKGSSIQIFNERMDEANKSISLAENMIKNRFEEELSFIKSPLNEDIKKLIDASDISFKHHYKIDQIANNLKLMKVLYEIDEKMNLNRKKELDEIVDELKTFQKSVEKFINDYPQRIFKLINEQSQTINCIIDEISKIKDELIYDNSHINELSMKYIEDKASFFALKYNEILLYKYSIEYYNELYKFDVKIADTKDILQLLHDYFILYKSTMLLKPVTCSFNLLERIENCKDTEFSLAMAYLYVNIFDKNKSYLQFEENIEDVKNTIMEMVQTKISLPYIISKLIFQRIYYLDRYPNKAELSFLVEFKPLLPYFYKDLKEYIFSNINKTEYFDNFCECTNAFRHLPNYKDFCNLSYLYKDDFLKKEDARLSVVTTKKFGKLRINDQQYESWCDVKTIVVDIGSNSCKAGYDGMELPYKIIKTVSKQNLELNLNNIYKELNAYSANLPILICEQLQGENRLKTIEILFETYNVPAASFCNSSALSILSTGRETGIVLDIGHEHTQIAPIYSGFHIPHASQIVNHGGKDVTSYLSSLLIESGTLYEGYAYPFSNNYKYLEDMKEKCGFVLFDFDSEIKEKNDLYKSHYTFPDKKKITFTNENFKCTEVLFKPNLCDLMMDGVDKLVYDSIMKCDADIHKDLFENIVLTGGTTMFEGFPKRFEKEIGKLNLSNNIANIVASPQRQYAAWIGGSIFASKNEFPFYAISKFEYNDIGPGIVNHRCF